MEGYSTSAQKMSDNMYHLNVNGKAFSHDGPEITGKQLLQLIGINHSSDYEILLKTGETEFRPIELDEQVNLAGHEPAHFLVKSYPEAKMEVDDENYPFTEVFMTPSEIMLIADLSPNEYYLKQVIGHEEISYKDDNLHIVAMHDRIKFVTCKTANTTVS